jgi:hypothetical protein
MVIPQGIMRKIRPTRSGDVSCIGPGLCRMLDMDFYEKAHFVKADVAAGLCG